MTAEIAILNSQAVALAADSAVTVGRNRVWNNANKLYSLSPKNDIAIMIYGAGDYLGFTWELIVKLFRQEGAHCQFKTVSECASSFFNFLYSGKFFDEELEKISPYLFIKEVLENIKQGLNYNGYQKDFNLSLERRIKTLSRVYSKTDHLDNSISYHEFNSNFQQHVQEFANEIFDRKFDRKHLPKLKRLIHDIYTKQIPSEYATGVVFAGYGLNQLKPEILSYTVDGKFKNFNRCWKKLAANLNDPSEKPAIVPFAQTDTVRTFMEGVGSDHKVFISETLFSTLNSKSNSLIKTYVPPKERAVEKAMQQQENEKIVVEFVKQFNNYIQRSMVNPVLKIIQSLPKEEMAAMAEAMVEITSLRRKVDSNLETVGGPIDVVLISKTDGLIWIKRKHYFDSDINKDFAERKRLRRGD